jgi:exosortase
MKQAADELAAADIRRGITGLRGYWWQAGLLAAALGYLYVPILARLTEDWWNDADASHGFLVIPFSLFVAWHTRRQWQPLPARPSWLGIPVIAGSLGLLIVGVLGVEFFLSRSSLIFLLAGLIICFLGWQYFRALLFPWAFLFLMIPIPAIVLNHVTLPLQLLASQLASAVLEFVGVPVLREGNVMQLASTSLEVAEACSGIRSLLSLVSLAVIYGYFLETRISRRALFAVSAVPIAVLANGFRVVGTGLLAHYWNPERAEGFFHTFSGWLIFVLAMLMLFSLDHVLKLVDRWGRKGGSP